MVAADEESPRDGRFLEILGHYNPRTHPATISLDEARIFHWLGNGAQPSDSARQVLTSSGCWGRWERLKAGESLEALVREGEKPAARIDPKTSQVAPHGRPSKKARARAEQTQDETQAAPAEAAEEA
jgi:small subunit ribosomal protein S16